MIEHPKRKIGGYRDCPDWPKLGPSLLLATCLILAIRTAKWLPKSDAGLSERDLEKEIDYAVHLSRRVLSALVSRCESIFPHKREVWYQPFDEDVPK